MKMMNFNKTFKVKQFARFYCNEVKLITKENLAKKIDSKSDYYLLVKNKKKKNPFIDHKLPHYIIFPII